MRGSTRWTGLVAAILGILAWGWGAGAQESFDGSREIELGDTILAEVAGMDGEVHEYRFRASPGTKVKAKLSVTTGNLVPEFRLVRPGGQPIDLGKKLNEKKPTSPKIGNFAVPGDGFYAFRVRAVSGTGSYELRTAGKLGRKLKAVAGATASVASFEAVEGTLLKVIKLSPDKGSPALPSITALRDPEGFTLDAAPFVKGKNSFVKAFLLESSGRYEVAWENAGDDGPVRVQVVLKPPKPAKASLDLGSPTVLPSTAVDTGDPVLAPLPGYVGSAACGQCHSGQFVGWSQTVHNNAVRTWDRAGLTGKSMVNDANGNGMDDFRDGLDLATTTAFASYGANAPRLSHVPTDPFPYKVTIGGVVYDIQRTMGGNGAAKQRYMTKVGQSYYVMPFQFNDAEGPNGAYGTYNTGDWYTGTTPKYLATPTAATIDRTRSFEANCSGCHNTGQTIGVDGSTGEFVTGYVEVNIGCEQCHGPGQAHVASGGNPALIANPRNLIDGTPAGVRAADAVCDRCHTRGSAIDAFPGTSKKAGFGFSQAGGVQKYGDSQAAFFVTTTSTSDYWGYKANPLSALPGATFVGPKSHRQQGIDLQSGPHAADKLYDGVCFDCHNVHGTAQRSMVTTRVNRGTDVRTNSEDNSLCLGCHATHGPFAGVTKAEAALIAQGPAPVAVAQAVVDHMKDVGMPVPLGAYDPVGTKVGQCMLCHMPETSKTAFNTTDGGGYTKGDVRSHTFLPVNPRASKVHGMTNSCNVCHDKNDVLDVAARIIEEWAVDGPEANGTFHADTPRTYQNGVSNVNRNGGVACVSCHTTRGFIDIQVKGEGPYNNTDAAHADTLYRNTTLKDALRREHGISCEACHGAQGDGTFRAGPNPLRFAKADLCGKCHNNQTVVFADFAADGEVVRHPQREMIAGTAGEPVPGAAAYGNSAHSSPVFFPDNCATCHYDKARGGDHSFKPVVATCNAVGCHSGLADFNRPAFGNYDGLNGTQGIQDEVTGLLGVLKAAIVAQPSMTHDGSYFQYGGATDRKLTGAPTAVKRAVFNYYSVDHDASHGIHNAIRTVQLLQRSYKELTGVDVPGATIR